FLHEEHVWTRRMQGDAVDAVSDLSVRVGDVLRPQSLIDRLPRRPVVVGPERTGGRDRDEHPTWRLRVEQDRVQPQPAGARRPLRPGAVPTKTTQLLPRPAAVRRAEHARILD